jgi:hypothetical protein
VQSEQVDRPAARLLKNAQRPKFSAKSNRSERMSLTDKSSIPPGYRQGFITAITVLLTASILYFRFAVFEPGSGDWSPLGVVAAVILGISTCIQLYTLWRALQPHDERIWAYTATLRWFAGSSFPSRQFGGPCCGYPTSCTHSFHALANRTREL